MVTRRSLFGAIAAIAALPVFGTRATEPDAFTQTIDISQSYDWRTGIVTTSHGSWNVDDDLTALYHEHFGGPGLSVYMDEETARAWDEIIEKRTSSAPPSPYYTTMAVHTDGTLVPTWEHPEARPDNRIVGYQMAYRNGDAGAYWTVDPAAPAGAWLAENIFSQDVEQVFVYLDF